MQWFLVKQNIYLILIVLTKENSSKFVIIENFLENFSFIGNKGF